MARIRTIKPELPQSESLGRVSRDARLLFINLFTIADDAGRGRGSSRALARLLYPFDDGLDGHASTTGADVERWLTELGREGCVRVYEFEGNTYFDLPKWLSHQKIDRPSKSRLPQFDETSRVVAKDREPSSGDLGPGPRTKDQPSSLRSEGTRTRRKPRIRLDANWKPTEEDSTYGRSFGLTDAEIAAEGVRFVSYWTGDDAKGGGLKRDWPATWRSWVERGAEAVIRRRNRNGHTGGSGRRGDGVLAALRLNFGEESVSARPGMPGSRRPSDRGGDGDGGGLGEGEDDRAAVIDADDPGEVPGGARGATASDQGQGHQHGRNGASVAGVRDAAVELSGRCGETRSEDTIGHEPVVAGVERATGTPGPLHGQASSHPTGAQQPEDDLEIPGFLRREPTTEQAAEKPLFRGTARA